MSPKRWLGHWKGHKKMLTRRYIVHGIVQGVGFRYFVYRAARGLELSGWVHNHPLGTVEVLARGGEERIAELEVLLRKGPTASLVDHLEIIDSDEKPEGNFRIGLE